MATCLISAGSNLGDRRGWLRQAVELLRTHEHIDVVNVSRFLQTRSIGGPAGQGDFLNAAVRVETSLAPERLLGELQHIEQQLSRRRQQRWGPRTIDLDLLLYDESVIVTDCLTIPHARMSFRRFVLEPAREIAPDMVHPICRRTVAQLCEHLDHALPYVALAGPIGAGKTSLARAAMSQVPGRLILEQLDTGSLAAFYRDPAGRAWHTEIEFLEQRKRSLVDCFAEDTKTFTLSDFWFDQSFVFAREWLPDDRLPEFESRWRSARGEVPTPKLTVHLDAPAEVLLERIKNRGRAYEDDLEIEFLERLRIGFQRQIPSTGGPLLCLSTQDSETPLIEIVAAIQAMA